MTPLLAAGTLAGLTLGVGLWLLVSTMPRLGRPRLVNRLAPYLVDVSAEARAMTEARRIDPLPVLGALVAPAVEWAQRVLDTVVGGEEVVRVRLRQSGSALTVAGHRTRQLFAALIGSALGIVAAIAAARNDAPFVPVAVVAIAAGAVGGIAAADALLAHSARRRAARIAEEFPTVVEFLALSVAAGESVLDALRRVARTGSGELAGEIERVVRRAAAGHPFAAALAELRDGLEIAAVGRLVDQILAALDRGTPLAEVLRAHALDARDESKRRLLEAAGTREVAMLVPLVFLILPVTVLFAIWPGLMVLQLGF
ncbi:type II secretion system F family protein [Microcella sp.]|uniref:type II secretion system F family protein n=1 Tax=Microcella sp. TaxID=1913979 RepID=UPI002566FEC8|nr:type II secretion system F family protein [Microcella sp.]MBX9471271.1 type II secretion system F family protein [Microcella sp.]